MARDQGQARPSSKKGGDARSLRVEAGECVVLSPQSDRFREHYRRAQPRTAKEARGLVGLSEEMATSLTNAGVCCQQIEQPAGFPAPDDLESEDDSVRAVAFDNAARGLFAYLLTTTPELLVPNESSIERYLELTRPELNLVSLEDIEVADGATLTISEDTHLVEANKIVLHGSGAINCSGFTKMSVQSMEGR